MRKKSHIEFIDAGILFRIETNERLFGCYLPFYEEIQTFIVEKL
jgi:hypothetical protein